MGKRCIQILQVSSWNFEHSYGGIETISRELSGCLGKDLSLGVVNFGLVRNMNGLEIQTLGRTVQVSAGMQFSLFKQPLPSLKNFLFALMTAKKSDLVILHLPSVLALMLAFFLPKGQLISFIHSNSWRRSFFRRFYFWLEGFVTRRSALLLFTSKDFMKNWKSSNSDHDAQRCDVVSTGLKDQRNDTYESGIYADLIENNPVFKDGFVIFVGAPRWYKNIDGLVSACGEANVPLLIVGLTEDSIGASSGLSDQDAICLGKVPEKEKMFLLRQSKFLVLPSNNGAETFGLVIIEAAMASKASVVFDLGLGYRDFVENDHNGILIAEENFDNLGGIISTLWSDDAYLRYLGRNAREKYEKKFSEFKNSKKFMKLIENTKKTG